MENPNFDLFARFVLLVPAMLLLILIFAIENSISYYRFSKFGKFEFRNREFDF